ncbi:MAG: alpha/beta hydrolase [Kofleriaceae bacterium]
MNASARHVEVEPEALDVPAALGDERADDAPIERACQIPATDGLLLGATTFEPAAPGPRRAIVMASATGVKRVRYREFARFLTRHGWSVVTFDYRGIGDSREGRLKELKHTMFEWGSKDLAGVISWIDARWAPSTIAAVTHSIGGQVLPFAGNHDRLSAMIAVGSQKGYWKVFKGWGALLCVTFFRLMPLLVRLLGYMPMRLAGCEDLPPEAAREWSRWGLHHDFVDREGRSLNHHHAAFSAPVLALSFADDPYAPPAAVDKLLEFYRGATCEHRHFSPPDLGVKEIGHSGFFVGPASETLWRQALAWLSQAVR